MPYSKGGADGFVKMSLEDKKRFLAAVTGGGGKIDGKAAAALIAAAASGGDPEIANKVWTEKIATGLKTCLTWKNYNLCHRSMKLGQND